MFAPRKIKILLNTSNVREGGALQVALSFIKEAILVEEIEFHIVLGRAIQPLAIALKSDFPRFHTVNFIPTDSLCSLIKFRRKLNVLERQIRPDGVITVFGQCYWRPESQHLMGFANGYLIYNDFRFQSTLRQKIKSKIKNSVHKLQLRREAKYFWVETQDAALRLSNLVSVPINNIVVATNNCSQYFYELPYEICSALPPKTKIRLIYISSGYPHKNHRLIPKVIKSLTEIGIDAECVVTLREEEYNLNKELHQPGIINIGPVHPKFCPYLYENSDILFMPSLLEIFSASYPEAMYMERPIVTSDLPFARSICGSAALYYPHDNPDEAAACIKKIVCNSELRQQLISNGRNRLKQFDTPDQRFKKVLEGLLNII